MEETLISEESLLMSEDVVDSPPLIHQSKKKNQRLHLFSPLVSSSIEGTLITPEDIVESYIEAREAGKSKQTTIRRSTRKRRPPLRFGEGKTIQLAQRV